MFCMVTEQNGNLQNEIEKVREEKERAIVSEIENVLKNCVKTVSMSE